MILDEVENLYKIIQLKEFRKTANVRFDSVESGEIPCIDGIDRVLHAPNAQSPGKLPACDAPWYMHPCQEDNLMVLYGTRFVEIFTPEYGKIERFTVSPNKIIHGEKIYNCAAMLVWPCGVFHRIVSGEEGSASVNFAVRFEGFDIDTNFNIYSLDTETGKYSVIRKGALDQN
jgi:hypothetical protein